MKAFLTTFVIVSLMSSTACLKTKSDDGPAPPPPAPPVQTFDWTKIADSAQQSEVLFFNPNGNYYQASNTNAGWTQYWPTAHLIDVLVDAYLRKPSPALKTAMDNALNGLRAKNNNSLLNDYYDDMEWMALACLRVNQATGDVKYRNVVDTLWSEIKQAWSLDLNGGIWWRRDHPSKNTPSNMPAAILAARLYRAFKSPEDLDWAKKIFTWQRSALYDANSGWVLDNIDKNGTKNTTWKFTYNQGTFLGAAMELSDVTGDRSFINDAILAADFTLNSGQLTNAGLLKDEGGGDGGLFKGVFVRYLTRLIVDGNIDAGKKSLYVNFLKTNAQSLWTKGATKQPVLFNTNWATLPGSSVDFTVQLSGIMLCEAMAELQAKNLIN
jgi:predicted alpha-1,6-mannanase (GH76 family)